MAIRFKTYKNNNTKSASYGKYYARPTVDETYDVDRMAEHMAKHGSPYSEGTIKGVLTDFVNCTQELITDGKAVKIEDLAIFSLGINSTGAASEEEFSVKENIKAVYLRARATGELSRKVLTNTGNVAYINKTAKAEEAEGEQ